MSVLKNKPLGTMTEMVLVAKLNMRPGTPSLQREVQAVVHNLAVSNAECLAFPPQ